MLLHQHPRCWLRASLLASGALLLLLLLSSEDAIIVVQGFLLVPGEDYSSNQQNTAGTSTPTTTRRSSSKPNTLIAQSSSSSGLGVLLHMGLYDTPLPPRPPPKEEDPNSNEDDDDDEYLPPEAGVTGRLFQFGTNGKEVNDLLPPLGRRLDSGVPCYYEATDRLVVNLVNKTQGCAVEDACWALEACRGDITEAWTRISTARRMELLSQQQKQRQADEDYDPEDYDLEVLDEFERRKRKLRGETEARRRDEYLKWSPKPDDQWLPTKNPKPIDDEPWFTG